MAAESQGWLQSRIFCRHTLQNEQAKWLITMVIVSPLNGVMGPLPNGLFMACKWGLLTTYMSWDDPPSIVFPYPLVNEHSWLKDHHFEIPEMHLQSGSIFQPAMLDYRSLIEELWRYQQVQHAWTCLKHCILAIAQSNRGGYETMPHIDMFTHRAPKEPWNQHMHI